MPNRTLTAARATTARRFRRSPLRRGRGRRAVSDVVATILILGLTVTLFASIFAFVGTFPQPPPQNVSQFQGSLIRSANETYITGVDITHLTGPAVPASDKVYIESASSTVSNWQFARTGGIPVYWGLPGNTSTTVWNYGTTWTTSFKNEVRAPDNITVYVISPTQLLFSAVLPGLVIDTPPAILTSGITPSTLSVDEGFTVWASLGGTLTGLSAKVNLGAIPGLSGNVSLTLQASGLYTYKSASGPSESGTWYAVIYVTNYLEQVASTSVKVYVSGSSSGGGSSQLSVSAGMSSPPAPTQSSIWISTAPEYFWGTVTYSGSLTANLWVNFTVVETVVNNGHTDKVTETIPGETGESITGPSSVTVYSQTGYYLWLIESTQSSGSAASVAASSVTVTANAVVGQGVGTGSGSLTFTPATPSPAPSGLVYTSTSTTTPYSSITKSFSHSCTTTSSPACPYLYYTMWDNYTAGPSPLTFSGTATVYGNYTTSGFHGTTYSYTKAYTIGSTSLPSGSANAVSVDLAGSGTRWVPSTVFSSNSPGSGATFVVRMYLTIYSGGIPVDYLYDAFSFSLT